MHTNRIYALHLLSPTAGPRHGGRFPAEADAVEAGLAAMAGGDASYLSVWELRSDVNVGSGTCVYERRVWPPVPTN
jgi:hypothetical protein